MADAAARHRSYSQVGERSFPVFLLEPSRPSLFRSGPKSRLARFARCNQCWVEAGGAFAVHARLSPAIRAKQHSLAGRRECRYERGTDRGIGLCVRLASTLPGVELGAGLKEAMRAGLARVERRMCAGRARVSRRVARASPRGWRRR